MCPGLSCGWPGGLPEFPDSRWRERKGILFSLGKGHWNPAEETSAQNSRLSLGRGGAGNRRGAQRDCGDGARAEFLHRLSNRWLAQRRASVLVAGGQGQQLLLEG